MSSAYWNEESRLKDLFALYVYILKHKWTVFGCYNTFNPNIFKIVIQDPKGHETKELNLYPKIGSNT